MFGAYRSDERYEVREEVRARYRGFHRNPVIESVGKVYSNCGENGRVASAEARGEGTA